jgi:hypothetical protein
LPAAGLGLAVADRLYRAAEGQVIDADAGGATEAVLALIA